MKKCEICNKEINKGSPFNTDKTHGKCVQNEFRDLLNKELEKQRESVAKGETNINNKKPELYYCYCIPMSLWIIDSFNDGTRKAETKEWWDEYIREDTEHYKLVKVNDEDQYHQRRWTYKAW